ncbi:MAG: HAD family hydrolase, partial [Lachnospiraceae bacterium]|nr:HAD family hydrolase [Lachnospiraceae bacterium]
FFDLYGTLIDVHTDEKMPRLWRCMSGWYADRGAVYTPGELRAAYLAALRRDLVRVTGEWGQRGIRITYPEADIGIVFRDLFGSAGITADEALIRETAWFFRQKATTHLRLYAGVKELLSRLKKAGKQVYVLSNAQSLFTMPELEKLGIAQDFDGIFISSDCGAKKPETVFYRKALEDTGLKAQECLMVGNDYTCDVAGARRAGMDSFYILSGLSPKEGRGTFEKDRRGAALSLRGMDLEKACRMILARPG